MNVVRLLIAGLMSALLVVLTVLAGGVPPATAHVAHAAIVGHAPAADTDYGRMMLVLDASGSMAEPAAGGTTKIDAARTALTAVVDALPEQATVGVRVFGATVYSKKTQPRLACTDSQLVVPPETGNRAELRKAIRAYRPYGETPIAFALREAAKDIGSEGSRSIVLVSDGIATCDPDPCVVAQEIAADGIDLQIDVVGLGVTGAANDQLRCIAKKGNGTYYDVDSADDITRSLVRVAERAARPFVLDGKPIQGAPVAEQATPIIEGVWTDTVPAQTTDDDGLWYEFTRTHPGSTVHVGVTSTGEQGEWDTISVELQTSDGQGCDVANDLRTVDGSSVLGAEAISHELGGETGPCATAPTLRVRLYRGSKFSQRAAPAGLLVAEEPPVSTTQGLPPRVDSDSVESRLPGTGPAKPVLGGASFPAATALEPGSYRGTTVPTETQVFKVRLGWGERLSARFTFPEQTEALRELAGIQGPFATVKIYNPLRAAVSDYVEPAGGTAFATSSNEDEAWEETFPVRFANRSLGGTYSSVPGDYYVALSVDDDSGGQTYELPFTLDIGVTGEPGGAPDYVENAAWNATEAMAGQDSATTPEPQDTDPQESGAAEPTESPTDDDTSDGASGAEAGTPSEDGITPVSAVVGGGLAVLAVGCLAAAVLLLRRRPS